jgi:hypothetical protein
VVMVVVVVFSRWSGGGGAAAVILGDCLGWGNDGRLGAVVARKMFVLKDYKNEVSSQLKDRIYMRIVQGKGGSSFVQINHIYFIAVGDLSVGEGMRGGE